MTYDAETSKLDKKAVDGLLGVEDSIAYYIAELERHFHNTEKWFGMALVPDGEDHVADRMAVCDVPFTFTAGNDTFGPWVQILGTNDTPVKTGAALFDAHHILVTETNSTLPFIAEIVAGETADIATKLAAEEFSEVPYKAATNSNDSGIEAVKVRRTDAGEKVWARVRCIGGNGSTISLFFGLHEYEG